MPVQQNASNINPDSDTCDIVSLLKYDLQYKLKLIDGNKPGKKEQISCAETRTRDFVM